MSKEMNCDYAREILDLKHNFTYEELRKSYIKKSLMYHPDKNPNGKHMFYKVKDSYDFLLKNNKNGTSTNFKNKNNNNVEFDNNSYLDILKTFIHSLNTDIFTKFGEMNGFNNENINFENLFKITRSLFENNQSYTLEIFRRLDKDIANNLFKIINDYKHILNIPNVFLAKLREDMNCKYDNLPIIIINAHIDDLLTGNIFVYKNSSNSDSDIENDVDNNGDGDKKKDEITYYIPLWHQELHFKNYIFHINVSEDDSITIDNDNNILVEKYFNINDIIENENIGIHIGSHLFIVNRSKLRFVEFQRVVLTSSGIPLIDENDIYNIEKKGDIIISFHIQF